MIVINTRPFSSYVVHLKRFSPIERSIFKGFDIVYKCVECMVGRIVVT
jgi:hypothetical protein